MLSTLIGALLVAAIVRQYGWRGLGLTIAGMWAVFIAGFAVERLWPFAVERLWPFAVERLWPFV